MDIIVPFLTGLTTGGLSCLAVQGGLLAGSIAHEVEESVKNRPLKERKKHPGAARTRSNATQPRAARPIVLFLGAKLVAYTVLGFFLGLLGSVLQLSSTTRAVLQAAIGIFMVGTALRMLNVHPIFRYFSLEPPHAVTRFIRRKAKGDAGEVTPVFLGALTVLIPCGVTQTMMAIAIGTGDPLAGATTMFAFILGTSPVFFIVAYLATRLGARLEASFMRAVAVVVLLLGLVSVDAGLTLVGWPYSVTNLRLAMTAAKSVTYVEPDQGIAQVPEAVGRAEQNAAKAQRILQNAALNPGLAPAGKSIVAGPPSPSGNALPGGSAPATGGDVLTITVANNGYSPRITHAKPNQPLRLALVTNKSYGCARAFEIPALGVEKILPPTGTELIDIPPQGTGSRLFFSCSMGMYSGVIIFDA